MTHLVALWGYSLAYDHMPNNTGGIYWHCGIKYLVHRAKLGTEGNLHRLNQTEGWSYIQLIYPYELYIDI